MGIAGPTEAVRRLSTAGAWAVDGVRLALMDLDVDPGEVDRMAAYLSEDERCRADRFARDRDARGFIVRRGRLRELLAAELGRRPEELSLTTNAFGKPMSPEPGLSFSVSHTADHALYAIACGIEVGCDIEARRPGIATPAMATRFFSPAEVRALERLPPGQWAEGFFNCWTRKEALVKGLGFGLSYPLESFDVSVAPHEPAALLRGPAGWRLRAFEPRPFLHAAVALGPACSEQPET